MGGADSRFPAMAYGIEKITSVKDYLTQIIVPKYCNHTGNLRIGGNLQSAPAPYLEVSGNEKVLAVFL